MMQKNFLFVCLIFGLAHSPLSSHDERMLPDVEQVFTTVYDNNWWWTGETCSGCGSNLHQTQLIRQEIPRIIKKYKIKSILDIPCGDFHWMQYVDLKIPYIGADIVKELVMSNQEKYQNEKRTFMHLDVITDLLPHADLILCRDCFVHLSYAQIWQALVNMKQSGAKYLLTTSYSNTVTNKDISAGSWRPLNLMAAPFNFSKPLYIFNEGYERDKCLVLWKLDDLDL
jgi:hypothetical protein